MPINFAVKAAVTAGLMVAQIALGAMRKIEGPRLDSLKTTVAEYGTPLDDFYGIRKLTGRPIIWADDLREVKKKTKTKGGKYAEYKYFGDWAVAIAGHEIDAVTRIWFDEHLVFDRTGVGPVALGSFWRVLGGNQVLKLTQGRNMKIYLGDESQLPDPVIEAWMEDQPEFGANCTSALRGISYIRFSDIPLEKFGNRLPQVTVEAVSSKAAAYPYEALDPLTPDSTAEFYFSPGGGWMVVGNGNGATTWFDVPSRTLIGDSETAGAFMGSTPNTAISSDGTAYRVGFSTIDYPGGAMYLYISPPMFPASRFEITDWASFSFSCTRVLETGSQTLVYSAYADVAGFVAYTTHISTDECARDFCLDADGDVAVLYHPLGSSSDFTIGCTNGPFTITGSASRTAPTQAFMCHVAEWNHFFVITDGYYYFIDDSTGAIKSSGTGDFTASGISIIPKNNAEQNPYLEELWYRRNDAVIVKISLEDASVLQTIPISNWGTTTGSRWAYDPVNDAIWTRGDLFEGPPKILYLNRVGSNGVTLGAILESEGDKVSCDINASALDQNVPGVSFGPGSVKDRVSPLLDLHDSITRLHDFTIQGIKRGTVSQDTIPTAKFTRDGSESRYEIEIAQDNDLPQRLEVKYAALNNDQELNNVIAFRHTQAVDTSRVQQIDMSTYADTPDPMQQKADRFLRRIWNSRSTVKNGLTAQYLAAETGDLYDLDLDGVEWTCELEKITLLAKQPGIKCEWRRTFPSLANLGEGTAPDMDGRTPDTIFIPSQTRGFVLDVPYLEDADVDINPTLYVAAGKYAGTWTGAVAWEGSDGTYDDDVIGFDSSQGSSWGFTTGALADANPNLWDRGNTFEVTIFGRTLSSSTEADIEADPSVNQVAIGANGRWEILNFTTATLTASTTYSRTYTISGLLRGRRGTEINTGNHEIGDSFLLLDQTKAVPFGADTIGDDLSFRVQSVGIDPETAPAIDIAPFTAASLKPYAPARIEWTTDGTDLFGEITRRSRTFSGWLDSGAVALGEASEAYEVDVMDGDTVVRTISVSGTNTFTYTAAQMSADGNTVADPPSVNVYQLSDVVGRGFALAA